MDYEGKSDEQSKCVLVMRTKKRENTGMNAVLPTRKVGNYSGAGFVWVV